MKAEDLIGTWRAAGHEIRNKDGSTTRPFGPGPHPGNIVYHPNGTVSVLVLRADMKKLAQPANAEEKVAALAQCVAYQGRYEVKDDTVIHHIEVSLNPAWIGTAQVRKAVLDGNRLTLSPPADEKGAVPRITWERVAR